MNVRGTRVELIKDGGGDTIGAVVHMRIGIWVALDERGVPGEFFADREDAVAHVKHLNRRAKKAS
jgi:hypothetical protein